MLEVIVKARELVKYTRTLAKQEKVFPKRDRWLTVAPIVKHSLNILIYLREANSINCRISNDYVKRRELQLMAYASCESLLSLLQIVYEQDNVEGRRIEYWTGLVLDVEKLLQAWTQSDWRRYTKMFPQVLVTTSDNIDTVEMLKSNLTELTGILEKLTNNPITKAD